jgi:hypothetical protein
MFACGSFVHQKCSNYALTNLLFGLCRFVWIIDPLVICPSPHHGAPACPSTLEVLWASECTPTLYPFVVFTFGLIIESIKELGVHQWIITWFWLKKCSTFYLKLRIMRKYDKCENIKWVTKNSYDHESWVKSLLKLHSKL